MSNDSCVFLVHVPDLRRFKSDVKKSLADLAWINAQSVIKTTLSSPPATVVVGIKGAAWYDTILIGDFIDDPATQGDGIKTRGSGIKDIQLLYPFFPD